MTSGRVKISDALSNEYSDFLSYCDASGKIYVSELANVDYVAFRISSGRSREYVESIKATLNNPVNESSAKKERRAIDDLPSKGQAQIFETSSVLITTSAEIKDVKETFPTDEGYRNDNNFVGCDDGVSPNLCIQNNSIGDNRPIVESSDEDSREEKRWHKEQMTVKENEDSQLVSPLEEVLNIDSSDFSNVHFEILDLGTRSTNCLNSIQCITIADILKKSINDLRSIRSMGQKSIDEIVSKLKKYISQPETISKYENKRQLPKLKINQKSKRLVEAFLSDESSIERELLEENRDLISAIRHAVETIGKDICQYALDNPSYSGEISSMLSDFSSRYGKYYECMERITQKIKQLPQEVTQKRLLPFMRAYSPKSKFLSSLLSSCDDTTTVACIPLLNAMSDNPIPDDILAEEEKFIDWLNIDIDVTVNSIWEAFLSDLNDRSREIFSLRAEGKTLETVGKQYGITRERIRQIESKVFHRFWKIYLIQTHDLIMLVYALRNGDNVLHFEELKDTIGDFASILWFCLKYAPKYSPKHKCYYYSQTLDAIIFNIDNTADASETVLQSRINKAIAAFPKVLEKDKKREFLLELAERTSLPLEILKRVFKSNYQKSGILYHKGRLAIVAMCEYVLKHRFPAGFKIADEFEEKRFKKELFELFGYDASNISGRSLDAKITGIGVLCDRGKYIHPDLMQVSRKLMDAVNDYIEASNKSVLPYTEIYEAMKEKFVGTQITNRYILQGAFKKYGCKFSTGKDFVKKTESASFVDEIDSFVEERGIVHKLEIFSAFPSLDDARLSQVVSRSENVFSIDNGEYIHVSQFDIEPEDYDLLRQYLTSACRDDIPVSILSVQEDAMEKYPEFMFRNDFSDKNKLFAALNYMFRGEFNFSRPYIAKLGVKDISNRNVILQHIKDYDSIGIDELVDICDDNGIGYLSLSYLCQSLAPDFVRINKDTLMRRELTGITDETIDKVVKFLEDSLRFNEYVVGARIDDFIWLPEIDVEWNDFLLESLAVQSGKIHVLYLIGSFPNHSNAVYVSDAYKNDKFSSFLIRLLKKEVHKGSFTSKTDMREWLQERGLIAKKLPAFIESAKHFYVSKTGVHCTDEKPSQE